MDKTLSLREEASLIVGLRLPDDPMMWEPFLKDRSTGGSIDQNKKWNLLIMLMMRVNTLEKKLQELQPVV
jgi:hypothetical protein